MASEIASTLTRLGEKSRFLTERYKVVVRERDEALQANVELKARLRQCEQQLETLRVENEYLRVSSVMAPSADSVAATRMMIKELIAEVERCLEELREN